MKQEEFNEGISKIVHKMDKALGVGDTPELKEFRVVRKVIATQDIHVNAVDKDEALFLAIRSQNYEWATRPAIQEIDGMLRAMDVTEPTEIPEV